jgi:hypothetical protein
MEKIHSDHYTCDTCEVALLYGVYVMEDPNAKGTEYLSLRTITEWSNDWNVTVLDPDGFDRKNPDLHMYVFTEQQFLRGLVLSTITWDRDGRFAKSLEVSKDVISSENTDKDPT